jgi:mannose-6-phosphate isomerase-like protein (cupin superfamily)
MQLTGMQKKSWGHEYIFATNELYTGKILHFDKSGNKFSMHFHRFKDETWYVLKGSFKLIMIDTTTTMQTDSVLNIGDSIRIFPCHPHQLVALEDNSEIIEVSTPDSVEDNYRIMPGDSQL